MSALRVVKLGGSLLDFPELAPRLRAWLAAQTPMTNLMLVGGGRLADAIREAYAVHPLAEEAAHWLCIRLLGVTAELVANLLPEARFLKHLHELAAEHEALPLAILDPEPYLRDEAVLLRQSGWREIAPLPHSWDVTSDSIAARLARFLRAAELVLLKSSLPDRPGTAAEAAEAGYVDRFFPNAAVGLVRVRCVNLRSERFDECDLRTQRR